MKKNAKRSDSKTGLEERKKERKKVEEGSSHWLGNDMINAAFNAKERNLGREKKHGRDLIGLNLDCPIRSRGFLWA